jgi:hypothetical protein
MAVEDGVASLVVKRAGPASPKAFPFRFGLSRQIQSSDEALWSKPSIESFKKELREGLRELGFVEGQNTTLAGRRNYRIMMTG